MSNFALAFRDGGLGAGLERRAAAGNGGSEKKTPKNFASSKIRSNFAELFRLGREATRTLKELQ